MSGMNRIAAVFLKDLVWVWGNKRLFVVMVLPLIIALLQLFIPWPGILWYVMSFLSAFVGLMFTSAMMVEEKRRGTLVALLISPLRPVELLIAKILFSFLVCFVFSLFALGISHQLSLLAQPAMLAMLLLHSSMLCFYGWMIGLFCKNEQEAAAISPVVIFLFLIDYGLIVGRSRALAYSLPHFHFQSMCMKFGNLSIHQITWHLACSALYFTLALGLAAYYTGFFFSNSRERRISPTMIALVGLLIAAHLITGFFRASR